MGPMINAYTFCFESLKGKTRLRGTRRTWENTIKVDLTENRCEDVNCICLVQDGNQS
jgi:hypothetical protein